MVATPCCARLARDGTCDMPVAVSCPRYVHHGSLDVPRNAERAYECAERYLCRDAGERSLFRRLEHSSRHFRLTVNHRNDDSFDSNTNKIAWDPYSALRTSGGGRQSPALGLAHEVDHAVEPPAYNARLSRLHVRG